MTEKLIVDVVDAIRRHEGDHIAGTGASVNAIIDDVDAPRADVEDALHDALMQGLCYQPDGERYRAI